ncbi:hypothetical protein ThidrDRAFT_2262 [Thiorhodococcus drewsii AZ1]|uniref:Uncharacterized protein n=1 Tax=Thiorhodococcus drewsii AZ1 TaxID=765913 RepID=G2E1U9_9GAMM|nr:hypothetical protein ThidrDRAFT_2262 [Thiorhodococcus drewsii AZ1]
MVLSDLRCRGALGAIVPRIDEAKQRGQAASISQIGAKVLGFFSGLLMSNV